MFLGLFQISSNIPGITAAPSDKGKSHEATSSLTETYAAVGVIEKLVKTMRHLLSDFGVDVFGNFMKKQDDIGSRSALRLATKLLTRLVYTNCQNSNPNPVLEQMETSLTSDSGLCKRLLIESETREDCLSWINRLLRFGLGVDLAQTEVIPVMSALIVSDPKSSSNMTVTKRLFSCLCALRKLRPEVGLDLQIVKFLALRLQEDPGELRQAVQEAVEDLSACEIMV